MRLLAIAAMISAGVAATATASAATAHGGSNTVREHLSGYQETPLALSTTGSGEFRVKINTRKDEISYRLSYEDLEAPITQAHIHFGAPAQTGGISTFLCTNMSNGPAGTQTCPDAPATVTGTIRPADIIGPAGQGIAAGEFDELVDAIRAGAAYVNVHTTLYPGGEIRAQLDGHGHHH